MVQVCTEVMVEVCTEVTVATEGVMEDMVVDTAMLMSAMAILTEDMDVAMAAMAILTAVTEGMGVARVVPEATPDYATEC